MPPCTLGDTTSPRARLSRDGRTPLASLPGAFLFCRTVGDMIDTLRGVLNRLGRRGAFLLFLSLLDILYGWSMLVTPLTGPGLHLVIPLTVWGWVWIGTGILLLPGALLKQDRLFFGAAALLKALWAAAWVSVWVSDAHVPRAWVSVAIWAAFSMIVLVVASWPEVHLVGKKDTSNV